jgi:hypothetical protein
VFAIERTDQGFPQSIEKTLGHLLKESGFLNLDRRVSETPLDSKKMVKLFGKNNLTILAADLRDCSGAIEMGRRLAAHLGRSHPKL